MEWTINNDRTILYTCTVEVEKESDLPSKLKYKVELFLLGEEVDGDNYILMHWEPSGFIFPDGEDSSYKFTTKEIPFRTYPTWGEAPYRIRGQRYMGYIVSVSDNAGNIFKYDSDLPRLPWLDDGFPAAIEKLREIYKNGRGSTHSRHFNDSFRKTQTPRNKWHRRANYF